jgi:hypothetical protein
MFSFHPQSGDRYVFHVNTLPMKFESVNLCVDWPVRGPHIGLEV